MFINAMSIKINLNKTNNYQIINERHSTNYHKINLITIDLIKLPKIIKRNLTFYSNKNRRCYSMCYYCNKFINLKLNKNKLQTFDTSNINSNRNRNRNNINRLHQINTIDQNHCKKRIQIAAQMKFKRKSIG